MNIENLYPPINIKDNFLNLDPEIFKNSKIHCAVSDLTRNFYSVVKALGIKEAQDRKDYIIFNAYKNLGTTEEESVEVIIPKLEEDTDIYNIRPEIARGIRRSFKKEDGEIVEKEEQTEPLKDENIDLYLEMMKDCIRFNIED